jgi:hypothetical protein
MAKGAAADANRPAKLTIFNTLKYIYSQNGLKGLYRGVTPRIGLGVWQTICMVSFADYVKAWYVSPPPFPRTCLTDHPQDRQVIEDVYLLYYDICIEYFTYIPVNMDKIYGLVVACAGRSRGQVGWSGERMIAVCMGKDPDAGNRAPASSTPDRLINPVYNSIRAQFPLSPSS